MGTDSPTQTDAGMDVHHLPWGAGSGWPSCLSHPSSGSQILSRRLGEVDEEGGHLYGCIKMLYAEDYCLEPVQTQGTEDAISLVSRTSCYKMKSSYEHRRGRFKS